MRHPDIEELAALVHRESGIVVRAVQFDALEAALERAYPGVGAGEFVRLCQSPAARSLIAHLLDEATVKETFFLRDATQLDRISWPVLLEGARRAGADRVRVWSAACATGEEAYSVALLASQAFGTDRPPITILGTDISGGALAQARRAEYRPRSVRHLSDEQRRRFFVESGEHLVVGDALRALVTFAPHNLVLDRSPPRGESPFDLILCRNVLMYFDAGTVDNVIVSLERALTPSGSVIFGAADALCRRPAAQYSLGSADSPSTPPRSRVLRRPLGHGVEPKAPLADSRRAITCLLDGLAELASGNAPAAVVSLRRTLYLNPDLGLAAFQLGRAHEALGDRHAARRAYEQALRTLEQTGVDDDLQESVLGQVRVGDLVQAAHLRLDALSSAAFATTRGSNG